MAGRPRDVSDNAILGVIQNSDHPSMATSEIADELPLKERATLYRLRELEEQGRVESRLVGQSRMWWIP